MKINRHWHRLDSHQTVGGHPYHLTIWGGSLDSVADATEAAKARLSRAIERLSTDHGHEAGWNYEYSRRDIREPIHEESVSADGTQDWVITRNRYGALVLNTADVMFIDIDHVSSGCLALFSRSTKEKLLEKIRDVQEKLKIRLVIYETAGGYRLLVTDRTLRGGDPESTRILKAFGSDPLYVTLCQTQSCYRARLTPKFYRVGIDRPEITVSNIGEPEARRWIENYESRIGDYATCRLIKDLSGRDPVDPRIAAIRDLHDTYALKEGSLA